MVRRPSALLGLPAASALLLLAGGLPDAGPAVAAAVGALAVAVCALTPLAGRGEPLALVVFGAGAALLAVALNAEGVGAGATPVEALFGAAAGLLFALAFDVPAAVVALPLLVAGIDLASAAGGTGAPPTAGAGDDVLTLALPRWGGGGDVARLGLLDAAFLALFAAWSVRHGLRPRLAVPLMAVLLATAAVLGVTLERAVPTLPFLAAGLLLPALDRIPRLVRGEE